MRATKSPQRRADVEAVIARRPRPFHHATTRMTMPRRPSVWEPRSRYGEAIAAGLPECHDQAARLAGGATATPSLSVIAQVGWVGMGEGPTPTLKTLLDARAAELPGRSGERAALVALAEGERPLVAIAHGIAGVGKSALLRAAACDARRRGATVLLLDGRAVEPT